jgi:TPR repeat protein
MNNNKHSSRLACLALSVLVFSPALAGFAEGVSAQRRGDYETARREYLEAAQDGNSNAQNNLGHLYRQGLGGPVDMKQAVDWFSKAAQAGQVNAETSLGDMYETGDAGAVDLSAAASWYHRAAVSGFFIAQLSLGQMREAGRGVPQDAVIALAWYTLAARADVSPANGYFLAEHAKAVAARDSLSARISSDQRAAAEDLANRWKPGYDMQQLIDAREQEKQAESEQQKRDRELQRTVEAAREQQQADQQQELQRQQKAEHDRQVGLCVSAMLLRPTVTGSSEAWSNAALCRLDPQAAMKIPPPSAAPPPSLPAGGGAVSGPAFYRGEQRSGFNKICMYDRLGSAVAITVGAMEMCPRVVQ